MVVLRWSFQRVVRMTVCILLNRFDLFVAIEGNRGLGKSTLGYHLCKAVTREFKRLYRLDEEAVMYYYKRTKEPKGISLEDFVQEILNLKEQNKYSFKSRSDLLYTRQEVLQFFHKWRVIGIADEMINVSFNRDFYNEEQKDLVKMINMNRDHCNLFVACVPHFQNLDSQIKNLCKLRFTVVRRGVCIVQTPNRTIYSKDKWDSAINERIERDWIKKGVQNPHYSKLTTFRGMMRFPPLSKKQEDIYQSVKDNKRNLVARDQMGIKDKDEQEKKDIYDVALDLLTSGKIKNAQIIEGIALTEGKSPESFKASLKRRLMKEGKPSKLPEYYWENRKKYRGENDEW